MLDQNNISPSNGIVEDEISELVYKMVIKAEHEVSHRYLAIDLALVSAVVAHPRCPT